MTTAASPTSPATRGRRLLPSRDGVRALRVRAKLSVVTTVATVEADVAFPRNVLERTIQQEVILLRIASKNTEDCPGVNC